MMKRIDFHHHIVPAAYRAAMARQGLTSISNTPFPAWKPEDVAIHIETLQLSKALLSVSAPGVTPIQGEAATDAARASNDTILEMRARDPDRIGGFSMLPLPDMDASLKEYERTRKAGMEGVCLLTNYRGVYISGPETDAMLAELNRHKALVFVHPSLPAGVDALPMMVGPAVLEFTFDTTRTINDLILRGQADKYPDIRWVFAHMGGAIPFLAGRLRLMEDSPLPIYKSFQARGRRVVDYLRGFSYDCAMSAEPASLKASVEILGADRIVFGSDVPFAEPTFIARNTKNIGLHLSEADQRAVNYENGEKLLTRD